MIKLIFCIRRLPTLTFEQFSTYWRDTHAPLVREVAPLLNISRYVQSRPQRLAQLDPVIAARGVSADGYDGVAELWWRSMDDLLRAGASRDGRDAGRRLLNDERNFIDLERSSLFFMEEEVAISGS